MPDKKPIIFSGIKPSGSLHLGNYIGAISQWVKNQDAARSIFCVVDLHAITVPQDPQELKTKIREVAALYLTCGIDPKKSIIFVQSHNSDHAELAWIFDCLTPMGWLKRMTQFKEKSVKQKEIVSAGLFTYPSLMAADILLYHTDQVPVGEDQVQHVELTRDIARKFNEAYGKIFTIPRAMLQKSGARIMSLQNPTGKMGKSDENEAGAIFLLDEPDEAARKIQRAVTDLQKTIEYNKKRPGISNLLTIYAVLSGKSIASIEEEYAGSGYKEFKEGLAEVVVEFLRPLQKRYNEIVKEKGYLERVLQEGNERAREISSKVLKEVKDKMGLG